MITGTNADLRGANSSVYRKVFIMLLKGNKSRKIINILLHIFQVLILAGLRVA